MHAANLLQPPKLNVLNHSQKALSSSSLMITMQVAQLQACSANRGLQAHSMPHKSCVLFKSMML
jgi:hypothetical protein